MSPLVLMYHRARAGRHGNSPEVLDAHFAYVAGACWNLLPGEEPLPGALNVCLTFDDGYYDFYAVVFPLLKKHRLRAVLAIPPLYVLERTDAKRDARLGVETDEAFANPACGGFCTWPELEEMAQSGHVVIAAHGFSHQRLDEDDVDLAMEIDEPQALLRSRLRQPVDAFVFPYGRYSARSLRYARQRYRYVFRIGGASNRSWSSRMLYRVDADAMPDAHALFSAPRLAQYGARYFWNRLRRR